MWCLATCYSQLATSQIILPIEMIGDEGLTKSVKVNVVDASKVKGLWMLVNNLSYENKASVKINNGAWVKLNNTTVVVPEPAKSYGGIGGGYHVGSIKLTLPLATGAMVNGDNTISFKFEYSDGLSSGYRVVRLNLVDATGKKLLPPNTFVEEDPNTWKQPIAGAAAAAAGKVLWETKSITEGPKSAVVLKAKCADCHAKNGRDLKYFNYSNASIIARSKFHKLNQTEAEQVASYIRSLDVPNPGRPWNPPYQPGPGLDSKPINEWSAGAGIDWVLEKDEMAFPFLFPNGIDSSAISLNKTLNVRETPVMLQLMDWNHWLPTIHPYDAAFGDAFFNSPANKIYNGEGSYSGSGFGAQYSPTHNLTSLIEGGPNQKLPYGAAFRSTEGLGNMLGAWEHAFYYNSISDYRWDDQSPNWTKKRAVEIISAGQWFATKSWEMIQGNDLEGMGKVLYGPKAEERSWPGLYRHVFEISPFLSKIPDQDSISFNGRRVTNAYINNSWYHTQPILSSGNLQAGGFAVVDWQYAHDHLGGLKSNHSNRKNVEPGRKLILFVKQMQQKHQNFEGIGPEEPYVGWELLRDHKLTDMVDDWDGGTWQGTDPDLKRQQMDAILGLWYKKSVSYPASQYKTGTDGYTINVNDGGIFSLYGQIPNFRKEGVNCELLNKIVDMCKALYTGVNGWDALKVSCPKIDPQLKLHRL